MDNIVATPVHIKLNPDFDTLVIAGGSIKGIASLGTLQYTYDNYLLKNIKNYIGTSSGAICCYLLAIGYTPIEIIVYICSHQLLEKMQFFNIIAMMNGSGASSFTVLQEHLEKMTIEKIGKLVTLKDIKEQFGKTLICVSHNLTKSKTEYLGPDNYPDLPAIIALRMTSNLPLIFDHFKYDGSFWLDGGVSNNFPINKGDEIGEKILGIIVDPEQEKFEDVDINVLEYFYKLMFIPISQHTEHVIENASKKCTIIRLSFSKIKFFNFSINSTDKLNMFSAGYQKAKEHFET